MTAQQVMTRDLRFPEGPVALPDGSCIVAEIARGTVSRVTPDGRIEVVAETGGGPNGIAVGPDGAYYVCNNGGFAWPASGPLRPIGPPADFQGGWVERVDPVSGAVRVLYRECGGHRLTAPNDIVFDAQGGFYFTDYGKNHPRHRDFGGLYYAEPDGSRIVELAFPVLAPNGIALSPDGDVLYVVETDTARLWAFDLAGPGTLATRHAPAPHGGRLVVTLPGYQRLDGIKVTAAGNIAMATLVTGAVTTVAPDGRILGQVTFPDSHTTNLAFGGPDLTRLYVTQSYSGELIALDWPEPGLRLNFQP